MYMENKNTQKRLLVIDDEENMRHMLNAMLKKFGYIVDTAADGYEGLMMLDSTQYDFILCDIKMPKMNGIDFLKKVRNKISATIIMMSAYGTMDTAIEAMKEGAYDYISKPFKADEVFLSLKKAEERERLKSENRFLRQEINKIEGRYSFGNMIAKSKNMETVFTLSAKAAQYNTTVLIIGESGTGKELIARGIHFAGNRSKKPLVPVNCGGIPENLLESELFGYKKGAFTGADRDKKGLFEEADGGTILLDEIGEMPLSLQVKILRVLQESEIRPIGDSKTKKIDVRVIAATSKNLEEEIKTSAFRQDLYYRLNVLTINIPPLRERIEDVPLLCEHFINTLNIKLGKDIKSISPSAMSLLLEHEWPGNVRELENVIERAVVLAEQPVIIPENLPSELIIGKKNKTDNDISGYSIKAAHCAIEKKLIEKALEATNGNRTKASQLLEISHPSLLSKMKTYDIKL
uniref:Acetoacetate metabolism regulatory protein atoC n=2 Tax=Desulfobacterium TaxID=2295 RepID=E1YIF6_9BACT|nr:Acetoacetate metabolism regulatory protein atoC [uncultured Desulfobacterium sp.]